MIEYHPDYDMSYFVMDTNEFVVFDHVKRIIQRHKFDTLEEAEEAYKLPHKKARSWRAVTHDMYELAKDEDCIVKIGTKEWKIKHYSSWGFHEVDEYKRRIIGVGSEWRWVKYYVEEKTRQLAYLLSPTDPHGPPPKGGRWHSDVFLCHDGAITRFRPGYMQRGSVEVVGPEIDSRRVARWKKVGSQEHLCGSRLYECGSKLILIYSDSSGSVNSSSELPKNLDDPDNLETVYCFLCAYAPAADQYLTLDKLVEYKYITATTREKVIAYAKKYGRIKE